jgi:multiple sugar transport system ATP-binding protein
MAQLQLDNLSKTFGRVKALQHISLNVADGEFLILLGPTGAGKTTTLRCVAGLEKPDAGAVLMDGQSINSLSPAERDVSLVFQSYALYPRKTVYENMAFPLKARKMSQQAMTARINEIAAKLRITELLNRRPAQLSGGQQQRVALGRAMVRQPRLFLMDEPLTNLDFKLRVEMRAELKRLQKELGATFFYVTNDQVEAMSMADRIAILHQGVLQQIDTAENIYDHPANLFVAGFVGSPRMNFLNCRLDIAQRVLVGLDASWQMPLLPAQLERLDGRDESGGLVLGVRPEDIDLVQEISGSIPATVYVVEPLGDRSIVDLRVGQAVVKVKVSATTEVASGQTLGVRFDPTRFHLFYEASGEAIL